MVRSDWSVLVSIPFFFGETKPKESRKRSCRNFCRREGPIRHGACLPLQHPTYHEKYNLVVSPPRREKRGKKKEKRKNHGHFCRHLSAATSRYYKSIATHLGSLSPSREKKTKGQRKEEKENIYIYTLTYSLPQPSDKQTSSRPSPIRFTSGLP